MDSSRATRRRDLSSINQKVRVRHVCTPRLLLDANSTLTDVQKSRVESTPFKSLLCMPKNLEINCVLLWELASRWIERDGGFRVRGRVIPFSPLDVCLTLGLRIAGERTTPRDDGVGRTLSLFKGGDITIGTIWTELYHHVGANDVDNFCRLYILLAFAEFYFPVTGVNVHSVFAHLLDDLDSLDKYSWGLAVYDFLVDDLTRVARAVHEGKNICQVHLTGCVALLQVWAFEHLSLCPTSTVISAQCFPRFLNWRVFRAREEKVRTAFEKNKVTEDLVTSSEENQIDIVREAIAPVQQLSVGHRRPRLFDMEDVSQVVADNVQVKKRISVLETEMSTLKQQLLHQSVPPPSRCLIGNPEPDQGTQSLDVASTPFYGFSEGGKPSDRQPPAHAIPSGASVGYPGTHMNPIKKNPDSNICTRVKAQPRNRVLGKSTRTPYTKLQKNKQKKTNLHTQLFTYCTRVLKKEDHDSTAVVKLYDQFLTIIDASCMKPRGWVNNMVIMLATRVFVGDEMDGSRTVTRHMFCPTFMDLVKGGLERFKSVRHRPWRSINDFMPHAEVGYDITQCNLIFAPVLFDSHWWCYVLHPKFKKLYVLDSMGSHIDTEKARLDVLTKHRFEELLQILSPTWTNDNHLDLVEVDLPRQCNSDDCGIYVIKYMELWDGHKMFGDKTMPEWDVGEVTQMRRDLLCGWVLHPKNECREEILRAANAMELLS